MKSFTELPITAAEWRRGGSTPPVYKLHAPTGIFASLTLLDATCTFARIETAEGAWTLKHLGILAPVVTLRKEGGTTNLATFHPHALRHGKLQVQDGATFDWIWNPGGGQGGAFMDPEGRPLVILKVRPGEVPAPTADLEHCGVELDPRLSVPPGQILLSALGWYLLLFDHLKERDRVAAETSLRV